MLGDSNALEVAHEAHVCFAFRTLIDHLTGKGSLPTPEAFGFPDASTALFVTWKVTPTRAGDHARLRGCIGILEPRQLRKALRDYALTSALRDKRFNPITLDEVVGLECTVSLLSCFELALGWEDWVVGQHGLIIQFREPTDQQGNPDEPQGCMRSATFLPEVAKEQGWSRQECIDQLIQKSGCQVRPITEALRRSLKVTRYQSTTCTLTYQEFLAAESRHGQAS